MRSQEHIASGNHPNQVAGVSVRVVRHLINYPAVAQSSLQLFDNLFTRHKLVGATRSVSGQHARKSVVYGVSDYAMQLMCCPVVLDMAIMCK